MRCPPAGASFSSSPTLFFLYPPAIDAIPVVHLQIAFWGFPAKKPAYLFVLYVIKEIFEADEYSLAFVS
jgi:hypothetical protein